MKLHLRSSFVVFVATTAVVAQGDTAPHYLMAAMGDSITAGYLASTSIAPFNSDSLDPLNFAMAQPPETHYPFPVTLALKLLESRKTLSWSTGRAISSHFTLLQKAIGRTEPTAKLSALNVALSGGLTVDLLQQADAVVKEMSSGKYESLKYITLLIGNNDLCTGNSDENIKAAVHEAFFRLSRIQQAEPIRILMSGLPRIPDTGTAEIKKAHTLFGMSCDTFRRKITHTCSVLTSWKTESQHDHLLQFTQSKNEMLARLADEANHEFQNLHVVFTDQLFNQPIDVQDLAIDCFHPNARSQARIAQELWLDQPWFR